MMHPCQQIIMVVSSTTNYLQLGHKQLLSMQMFLPKGISDDKTLFSGFCWLTLAHHSFFLI
jgi:hypothetical protein